MFGNSAIPISIGITNNTKGITARMIPRYRQFFAFFGSSSFITKYAITPPITLNKIGSKNQKLLRLLTCMISYGMSLNLKQFYSSSLDKSFVATANSTTAPTANTIISSAIV